MVKQTADELFNPPALVFLFGLAGAGKSYVGEMLVRRAGYHLYEGDADLPPEMRAAVARKEPFTDQMRDALCSRLIARIGELRKTHPRLVVTQALYKAAHRQRIQNAFPELKFVWVQATDETIQQRLMSRGDDVTPEYAARMRKNFEPPSEAGAMILNEGSEQEIWTRLERILC